jgi:Flp pilus assembly protein TadD
VHRLRGDCLLALGRHLEAVYAYEKAVHHAPIDARGWLALGRLLRLMRRTPAARAALEKARELSEGSRAEIANEARALLDRLS